jgi:hypothetical protein
MRQPPTLSPNRTVAYAREGVEDVWAEAQSIRRRNLNSEPNGRVRTGNYVGAGVPKRDLKPGEEANAVQADAIRYPLRTWMQASERAKTTCGASRRWGYAASSWRT